jgi:hypothetical protein
MFPTESEEKKQETSAEELPAQETAVAIVAEVETVPIVMAGVEPPISGAAATQPDPVPQMASEPVPQPEPLPQTDPEPLPQTDPEPTPQPEPLPQTDPEPLPQTDPEPLPQTDPEPMPQVVPEPTMQAAAEPPASTIEEPPPVVEVPYDPFAELGGIQMAAPTDDDPAYAATPLDDADLLETAVMVSTTVIPERVAHIEAVVPPPPVFRKHVPPGAYLETWGGNERMRHIPQVDWLRDRIDVRFRNRFETLWASYLALPSPDPRRAELEAAFRSLYRAIDRIAEAAKSRHGNIHPPSELHARIAFALDHALAAINSLDPNLFGRRFPVQTHERSKGEGLYGAILMAGEHLERVTILTRAIDPGLDERLLKDLVKLTNPVDERMLRPIA